MNATNTCLTSVEFATCVNLPGDYKCQCPTGYKDENRTCVDIDECQNQSTVCPEAAQCINSAGNYTCQCPKGLLLIYYCDIKPVAGVPSHPKGSDYKDSKCVQIVNENCPATWTKTRIDQRVLCYKDFGLHDLDTAHSLCTQQTAWLLVPRNVQENTDFKNLLKSLNLGHQNGAALGLRKISGNFVDRNNKRPTYRKGSKIFRNRTGFSRTKLRLILVYLYLLKRLGA